MKFNFMDYYNPTKQTKFDNEGNCLSAVIATLFNISIEEIPIFANDLDWCSELSKWMANKFGKYIIQIKLTSFNHLKEFQNSLIITTINLPNPLVERHAVITRNDRIVFDPMIGETNEKLTKKNGTNIFNYWRY